MGARLGDWVQFGVDATPAAIVLQTGLKEEVLTETFTPTHSAVRVLNYLSKAVLPDARPEMRAMNWWGTYGAGKSRLAVLAGQLLRDGAHSRAFETFLLHLENFNERKLADDLRGTFLAGSDPDARPYLIVPLYGSGTVSLQSKLLRGLFEALQQHSILSPDEILPKTEFAAARERLVEIIGHEPGLNEKRLSADGVVGEFLTVSELDRGLEGHDEKALKLFRHWHHKVCKGAEFRAELYGGKGIIEAYLEAGQNLKDKGYGGIAVIWDEFGSALEDLLGTPERNATTEIAELQRFVEGVCPPARGHTLFIALTHVSLAEYGPRSKAPDGIRDRLSTIEGRFTNARIELRPSESEGYHLLASRLSLTDAGFSRLEGRANEINSLARACATLRVFQPLQNDLLGIARDCYPLHPLAAAALLQLSAHFAQLTRTAFTYFAELKKEGVLERPVDLGWPIGKELIRLPELAQYYSDRMDASRASLMQLYRHAKAQVGEDQLRTDILSILLLANILEEGFQASEELLSVSLFDSEPTSDRAAPLWEALGWLRDAGVIWRNDVTKFWALAGEAGANPEALVEEALEKVPHESVAWLFNRYPELAKDLLPHLGRHDLEPSGRGIVRSFDVQALAVADVSRVRGEECLAARIVLALPEDVNEAEQVLNECSEAALGSAVFVWIPREGVGSVRPKLYRYLALRNLLGQSHSEGLRRQLAAKWEDNRNLLNREMVRFFGYEGLRQGTTTVVRAGSAAPLECRSWHEFKDALAREVSGEYDREVHVRTAGRNAVCQDVYTAHKKTADVVQRILEFAKNADYQNDLLGYEETSEHGAIVDGIFRPNRLFIQRPGGWDIKSVEEMDPAIGEIVQFIRGELLRRRDRPYSTGRIRTQLLARPYGIPPSALPIFVALALRDDVVKINWLGGRRGASVSELIGDAVDKDSRISTRFSDFTSKQSNVLRLVGQVLGMEESGEKDVNVLARNAVTRLREIYKAYPDHLRKDTNVDPLARGLLEEVEKIGNTPHDVANWLLNRVDPTAGLRGDNINVGGWPEALSLLRPIVLGFEQVRDSKVYEALEAVRDVFTMQGDEGETLRKRLSNTNEGRKVLDAIGAGPVTEKVARAVLGVVLPRPLESSTPIEVGRAIGRIEGLMNGRDEEGASVDGDTIESLSTALQRLLRQFSGLGVETLEAAWERALNTIRNASQDGNSNDPA